MSQTTPKKSLIIASSFKELTLADKVRSYLEAEFDITIWQIDWHIPNAPAFVISHSFLRDLQKASLQFDYALLLGITDDFKFGLFLGRMGASRIALLVEKGITVPSNLQAVVIQAQFEKNDPAGLLREVRNIRDAFINAPSYEVNLPSTTLAATYYSSIVEPLCSTLTTHHGFTLHGQHHPKCVLKIIIPSFITHDVTAQLDKLKATYTLETLSFKYKNISHNIAIHTSPKEEKLEFIDFPAVIAGIPHAITPLLPDDAQNNTTDYKATLARELDRFVVTIQKLCSQSFKDIVVIERK